jgi:hypothetical protein
MNGLIFLLVLGVLYYCANRYFPDKLLGWSQNHKYYFGGFVVLYALLYYMFVFESPFVNKVFQNIHDTTTQPLYSQGSSQSNADHYYQNNGDIKQMLMMRQAHRCYKCSNYLMDSDTGSSLTYKIPLQYGGKNEPHNLVVICPSCSEFAS